MSDKGTDPKIRKRRLIVRCAALALYIGLIVLAFMGGKGHTLLVDNKDAEDGSYKAFPDGLSVSVDGREPIAFEFGVDRDMVKLIGQSHTLKIEGLPDGKTVVRQIRLPVGAEMLLVSVPRLMAGLKPDVEVFVPKIVTTSGQSLESNAFTSPGGTPQNMAPEGVNGVLASPEGEVTAPPAP